MSEKTFYLTLYWKWFIKILQGDWETLAGSELKTLHLTLYRRWFIAILRGDKKIERRIKSPYWERRLNKKYDLVKFVNGYGAGRPWVIVKILKIAKVGLHYEIFLGEIIDKGNLECLRK